MDAQMERVYRCGMPAERMANLLSELAEEWERRGKRPFNFALKIRGHDGKVRGTAFDPGERDV